MNAFKILAVSLMFAACSSNSKDVSGTGDTEMRFAAAPLEIPPGMTRKSIPHEDPGPPMYARVSTVMNELFVSSDGWLVVPIYRDPACIPAGFNMLQLFDFPSAAGPGAFACPLVVTGNLIIEADAPLGTFPKQAVLSGDAVPFWFVPYTEFQAAAEDGSVTIHELRALNGRIAGVASKFHEVLMPREGDHKIEMQASGQLEDGRNFTFNLVHVESDTKTIQLRFR